MRSGGVNFHCRKGCKFRVKTQLSMTGASGTTHTSTFQVNLQRFNQCWIAPSYIYPTDRINGEKKLQMFQFP